jgi:hypothetical protein
MTDIDDRQSAAKAARSDTMRYTTVASAEAEGAYGFTSTLELQQGTDGRCRIVGSGFRWVGNEGGIRDWRDGPFNLVRSGRLLAAVQAAVDGLGDADDLTYIELAEALELR